MMCGVCTVQNGIHAALRSGIHAAVSLVRDAHIGRKFTGYQVGCLICDAWNKSVIACNATRGFKVTGIFPFSNSALPDHLFDALADSEVPVPENTTQEEENSSSKVLINTPPINLQPVELGTSSVKPPSLTKHLHKISSIPRLSQMTAKHRIKKTAVLLTSIDNRNAPKANLEKRFQKCKKINKKDDKTTKRKFNFESGEHPMIVHQTLMNVQTVSSLLHQRRKSKSKKAKKDAS
ncbi:hypothetical protein AVEN_84261-1 [Araneus ventricosus]|uniref:Uncharacterized protein n=1 Tax=Araneus ventricosus TaxID=182803 RepID=A0A4Y2J196_ARAVE|nr:hypothetical protein AVEN_84261-1 [Araneus ventricosus]